MTQIGPTLPPGFLEKDEPPEEENAIGPVLPSRSSKNEVEEEITGPNVGVDIQPPSFVVSSSGDDLCNNSYGPSLPPGFTSGPVSTSLEGKEDSDDDSNVIGPMPNFASSKDEEELQRKRVEIEARSKNMKDKLTGKGAEEADAPKRETWMTELPVEFKPLGIGARKFRTKIHDCGDRSVWTDTPSDRLKKREEQSGMKEKKEKEKEKPVVYASTVAREKALAEQLEKYNKEHRSQSLMEIHRKRRRAEECEKKGVAQERRPFDREQDLEAPTRLVTPAKRASLMKDSKQSLDNRFQRGSKSFL